MSTSSKLAVAVLVLFSAAFILPVRADTIHSAMAGTDSHEGIAHHDSDAIATPSGATHYADDTFRFHEGHRNGEFFGAAHSLANDAPVTTPTMPTMPGSGNTVNTPEAATGATLALGLGLLAMFGFLRKSPNRVL
jgi:hypothetical protein